MCPVNNAGKVCIEVLPTSVICLISETLCIGCGLCVKRCPFEAIKIINLPKELQNEVTHRYGVNSFKLHRLPTPRPGEVLGLVGTNGIGKSTALKILAGTLQPNLGKFENPPVWKDILKFFRGSELQNYFSKLLEENMKALIKVQYVDAISKEPRVAKVIVGKKLQSTDKKGILSDVVEALDLQSVMEREVGQLSGGELQRFVIAITCIQHADIYMFDEPSSYLDVKQRLKAAKMIRSLLGPDNYVIVVEHDLSILDYLSDFICLLYGEPGAYGVVTMPYSVREGINIFLGGFIPTENMRFRDEELTFKVVENDQEKNAAATDEKQISKPSNYKYPAMIKSMDTFRLEV
jgi:ATP-binding cassette subfamily E protein 1